MYNILKIHYYQIFILVFQFHNNIDRRVTDMGGLSILI